MLLKAVSNLMFSCHALLSDLRKGRSYLYTQSLVSCPALKPRPQSIRHFCACAAKADRLKQAKQEAEKEIKAYKAQREEAFQKRISDVSPPTQDLAL